MVHTKRSRPTQRYYSLHETDFRNYALFHSWNIPCTYTLFQFSYHLYIHPRKSLYRVTRVKLNIQLSRSPNSNNDTYKFAYNLTEMTQQVVAFALPVTLNAWLPNTLHDVIWLRLSRQRSRGDLIGAYATKVSATSIELVVELVKEIDQKITS